MNQIKPNSLTALGYTIKTVSEKEDDKGNKWAYEIKAPQQIFYIKRTKRGKLLAYKDKMANTDVTIGGMWDFQEHENDLVGRRTVLTRRHGRPGPKPVAAASNTNAVTSTRKKNTTQAA